MQREMMRIVQSGLNWLSRIAVIIVLVGVSQLGWGASSQPNVLILLSDDQQADSIAALSHLLGEGANIPVETPNLDRLANRGMVFNNTYHMGSWSGAVCLPSRTMIMTGRTPWHIPGRSGNTYPADIVSKTLPAAFNNAGYDTIRRGKNGNTYRAANAQFDTNATRDTRDATSSKWFADEIISFLDQRPEQGANPFLAYVGFDHPHDPRNAPAAYYDKYNVSTYPDPNTPLDDMPPLPTNYMDGHPFNNGALNIRDEISVQGVGTNRDERTIRNEIGKYYATIEYMDLQIGRILDKLDAEGETDNTIIVFASDHGLAVGRHGLMGKQNLYEHSWRTPLIIAGPDIQAGQTNSFAYLSDLFPTVADLAGVPIPDSVEAHSLAPILADPSASVRDSVYGVYINVQRSVRVGDMKLIYYPKIDHIQLFNLADDPQELNNLAYAPGYQETVNQLATELLALQTDLDDPYPITLPLLDPNGLVGDLNQDGVVFGNGFGPEETDDVTIFLNHWLEVNLVNGVPTSSDDFYLLGDLNYSGEIDMVDMGLMHQALLAHTGQSFPVDLLNIPEPTTLVLLGCSLVMIRSRIGRNKRTDFRKQ